MKKMHKKTIFILVLTVILLSCLTVIALSKDGVNDSKKEITIAFIDALTGPAGAYGSGDLRGAEIGVAEVNEMGGIPSGPLKGYTFVLDTFDDKGDAKESASAARKIAVGDYLAAIGGTISTASLASSPVFYRMRVPYIMGWASSTSLTHQGFDNLVRETYTTEAEAIFMLKILHERLDAKKVSIIVENASYGQQLLQTFQDEAENYDIKLGNPHTIVPGQDVDFKDILLKAKAEESDVVVILVERNEGGMIVNQTRKMGWDVPFYGPKSLGEPRFFELAGEELGEVYLVCSPSLDTSKPYVENFLSRWQKVYDFPPDMAAIYGYDAVKISTKIIEMGGIDRESFIANLRKVKVEGIGNDLYEFDEYGDVKVPNLITITGEEFKKEYLKME